MKKIEIKKIELKIFKPRPSYRKKGSEINPDFYWRIALYATVVLMLGAAVFGYWLFREVNKGSDASQAAALSSAGAVSKQRLDAALQYFADRKNRSSAVVNSPGAVVDPSI